MFSQNDKTKTLSQPTLVETWDVQVTEGQILQRLKMPTIVQGLREGWLSLDDPVRKAGEITWRPIREAFAKTLEVAVFLDPPRAYARHYGSTGGSLLAALCIFGTFLYGGIALFNLKLGNAFGFAIGLLIVIIGLSRGNLLISAVGLGIAAALAGVPINHFLNLGFLLGLSIGAALTGLAGWVIGYGPGYVIGLLLGSRYRGNDQLPATRQPVPDEIEDEIEKERELSQSSAPDQQSSNLFDRQEIVDFYKATLTAWSSGQLDNLNPGFRREVQDKSLDDFVKAYPPLVGGALHTFLFSFSPQPGEFLVGHSADSFVLTNLRLVQKDGKDNTFHEIPLAEVKNFKSSAWASTLTFEMETSQVVELSKLGYIPNDRFLGEMIKRAKQSHT